MLLALWMDLRGGPNTSEESYLTPVFAELYRRILRDGWDAHRHWWVMLHERTQDIETLADAVWAESIRRDPTNHNLHDRASRIRFAASTQLLAYFEARLALDSDDGLAEFEKQYSTSWFSWMSLVSLLCIVAKGA